MPDFKELAEYLACQMELGEDLVCLDEPWTISPVKVVKKPISSAPVQPNLQTPSGNAFSRPVESSKRQTPQMDVAKIVIPESAKVSRLSMGESASTLADFYKQISAEKFYAQTKLSEGEGNLENPKLLLVVYAPVEKYVENGYAHSDVGQMIARMFESLNISQQEIGVTYFCKKPVARAVLPQVAIACKKMLEKEVSLIRPQMVVFFGDRLLKQALSQNAKVVDFGGTPMEFAKVPATVLIDPEEMFSNKQLKWITWKVHIPKCGFFG